MYALLGHANSPAGLNMLVLPLPTVREWPPCPWILQLTVRIDPLQIYSFSLRVSLTLCQQIQRVKQSSEAMVTKTCWVLFVLIKLKFMGKCRKEAPDSVINRYMLLYEVNNGAWEFRASALNRRAGNRGFVNRKLFIQEC